MKSKLLFATLSLGLAAAPAIAQSTCPWAGGEYRFSDHGIYGDFSVNADCTEVVWDRLTDPETSPLEMTRQGWSGKLSKVSVILLEDGDHVEVTAYGGITRRSKTDRTN